MDDQKRIDYVVSLFPVIRETFIAREIIELERNGFDINNNIQPMLRYFETTTGAAATANRP